MRPLLRFLTNEARKLFEKSLTKNFNLCNFLARCALIPPQLCAALLRLRIFGYIGIDVYHAMLYRREMPFNLLVHSLRNVVPFLDA